MTVHTIPDIVGASQAVAISAVEGTRARRLFFTAHTTSTARFGDKNVAAAQGVELPADTMCTFSASDADCTDLMDLTAAFVYVPSGTTVSVAWAQ